MVDEPSASDRNVPELMALLRSLTREGEELRQRVRDIERKKREVEVALMDARRGT